VSFASIGTLTSKGRRRPPVETEEVEGGSKEASFGALEIPPKLRPCIVKFGSAPRRRTQRGNRSYTCMCTSASRWSWPSVPLTQRATRRCDNATRGLVRV
jgi:hypothetical protein